MKTLIKFVMVSALALGFAGMAVADKPQAPKPQPNPAQQLNQARAKFMQTSMDNARKGKMTPEMQKVYRQGLLQGFNRGVAAGRQVQGPKPCVKPVCPKAAVQKPVCPKAAAKQAPLNKQQLKAQKQRDKQLKQAQAEKARAKAIKQAQAKREKIQKLHTRIRELQGKIRGLQSNPQAKPKQKAKLPKLQAKVRELQTKLQQLQAKPQAKPQQVKPQQAKQKKAQQPKPQKKQPKPGKPAKK